MSIACLMALQSFAADKTPVWKDPTVNQVNREPRRANFFAFENADKAKAKASELAEKGKAKIDELKNKEA